MAQCENARCGSVNVNINLFDGLKQDSKDFLRQFKRLAVLKKLSDEEKLAVFSSYLKGAALSFYKSIEDSVNSFAELEGKFLEEFPPVINYEEKFYYAKQEDKENVLEYFYRLQELASKAGISEEEKFITQFLKSVQPFYKHKLATSIFEDKKSLKKLILQLQSIYEKTEVLPTNLPREIVTGTGGQNASGDSPAYRTPPNERVAQMPFRVRFDPNPPIRSHTSPTGRPLQEQSTPRREYNLRPRPSTSQDVRNQGNVFRPR